MVTVTPDTDSSPLDRDKARRYAYWLSDNGCSAVQVIETVPEGRFLVKVITRAGSKRVIASTKDWTVVRNEVAG